MPPPDASPLLQPPAEPATDISVVIVSFNTKAVLGECLETLRRESAPLRVQTIVVDNGSRDGSIEMVRESFPEVLLLTSAVNLGFAGANNLAFAQTTGRYIVLLNSDAFVTPGALQRSVERMDRDPHIGLGGARLVGRDGNWQPSARMFPSLLTDLFVHTGLANRYPDSRLFGYFDRTWADQSDSAEVDWVPGAYSILRREALAAAGSFDRRFFLYYEEVDLCHRIRAAGYTIWYWADVVVVHIGGESSRQLTSLAMSKSGAQLTLWRMRSTLLYYRKHHGPGAWLAKLLELGWSGARSLRRSRSADPARRQEAADFRTQVELMQQAWRDTEGGRISPPQPW